MSISIEDEEEEQALMMLGRCCWHRRFRVSFVGEGVFGRLGKKNERERE